MGQYCRNFVILWALLSVCGCKPRQLNQSLLADDLSRGQPLEFYRDRPEISTIPASDIDTATETEMNAKNLVWANYVKALVEVAAQFWGHIIGQGNRHHAYIMGRDAALLYDVIMYYGLQVYPDELHRIHLLNVSQISVDDPNLKLYLASHGISESAFKAGHVVHIWDTGWRGVTLGKVRSLFPEFQDRFVINFASSQNQGQQNVIPSSRLFLGIAYPDLIEIAAHSYKDRIKNFENVPRFLNRATGYAQNDGGTWDAVVFAGDEWERQGSLPGKSMLPSRREWERSQSWADLLAVDKNRFIQEYQRAAIRRNARAQTVQGNLVRRLQKEPMADLFETRLYQHWELADVIATEDRTAIINHLNQMLDQSPGDFATEAIVRDAVEKIERHYPHIGPIERPSDLRLPKAFVRGAGRLGDRAKSAPPAISNRTPKTPPKTTDAVTTYEYQTFVEASNAALNLRIGRETSVAERLAAIDWLVTTFAPQANLDVVMVIVLGDSHEDIRLRAVEYLAQNDLSQEGMNHLVGVMQKHDLIMDKAARTVALRHLEEASALKLLNLDSRYQEILSKQGNSPLGEAIQEIRQSDLFVKLRNFCNVQESILQGLD